MSKRFNALVRSGRIEHNLNEAKKTIVFDDEFERHKSFVQGFKSSRFNVMNRLRNLSP
jgi:hypothetical protein